MVIADDPVLAAAISVAISAAGPETAPGSLEDLTGAETAVLICPDGVERDRLRKVPPGTTVIVAGPADVASMLTAVENGALAYLEADAPFDRFVATVEAARRGEATVPPRMLGALLQNVIERQREARLVARQLEVLSPREREVFELVVQGADKHTLSDRLFISPETARTHIQNVMSKLAVTSRVELVGLAAAAGIPTVGSEGGQT